MLDSDRWVVAGLDSGGTTSMPPCLTPVAGFSSMRWPSPELRPGGPDTAIEALARSLDTVLELTGVPGTAVRAVGLDTPGPVTADGVICSTGGTNFANPQWCGFDVRQALEVRLGLPVIFNNDANAAALYAHHEHSGLSWPVPVVGVGDRGYRARWRRYRVRPGCSRRGRNGWRTGAHLGADGRAARTRPARPDVQLRTGRRCRERRL